MDSWLLLFNSGVIVVALALLLLDLQAMANWSKGTYPGPDPSLVGQCAGWGTALVAGVAMFAAQAMTFVYLVNVVRRSLLGRTPPRRELHGCH